MPARCVRCALPSHSITIVSNSSPKHHGPAWISSNFSDAGAPSGLCCERAARMEDAVTASENRPRAKDDSSGRGGRAFAAFASRDMERALHTAGRIAKRKRERDEERALIELGFDPGLLCEEDWHSVVVRPRQSGVSSFILSRSEEARTGASQ